MKLKLLAMSIKTDRPVVEDGSKLRGYIANKFNDYPILHHHIRDVGYLYTYPRVQYKIINGVPVIVGIEEGAEVLKKISGDIKELILGKNKYKSNEIRMNERTVEFGVCKENHTYIFLTPWLAFNPENYRKYKEINDWKEKKNFTNNILIGNILSMSKGLNYIVSKKIYIHSLLDSKSIEYKRIQLVGFTGNFKVNFNIPDYLGIGKGASQGFGVIKSE